MNGQIYAYFCIDSEEEREHCAEVARDYAVPEERVFIDVYRPDSARTEYEKLCETLTDSDTLVIDRLDQIGDTLEDIVAEWRRITKDCGAAVVTASLPEVDTRPENSAPLEDVVAVLLEYVSRNKHTFQRRRQAEGIAAAMERGVRFGRPRRALPENFDVVSEQWRQGQLSSHAAARMLGVSQSSFLRWAKEGQRQQ